MGWEYMKQRNAAIRRIVKAIESEYTEEGEFLLWETSARAVQKGSNIDIETIRFVFKLLKRLKLLKARDWSVSSRTYIVGFKYPNSNRIWIPALIALPQLLKLPVEPKYRHTKLRSENIHIQMLVDLFKSGMFAYLGDDLKGPEYPTMLSELKKILKSISFRQNTLIRLISGNFEESEPNVALINVFFDIFLAISPGTFLSFEYFIENKQLTSHKKHRKSEMYINLKLLFKIIGKNKIIRNTILRSIRGYEFINRNNIHFSNSSKTSAVLHSKQISSSNEKSCVSSDPAKQKILDAYWNARKCVYGVGRTLAVSNGYLRYSSDLPAYFRRAVNTAMKVVKDTQYPIPPRKLFMALFTQYTYLHKRTAAPRTWCVSDQFIEWAQDFATAYDELEQFREKADPVKTGQFESVQKFFFRRFEKTFGMSMVAYFGTHLSFYIDWCLLRAVTDFIIARTYFEHRTHIEATLMSYVLAQIEHFRYLSDKTYIHIDWIFGAQARSRMEVWIKDHDPDAFITSERREMLDKFFAEQDTRKMREVEVGE